jgi:gliding motility-associated-like protein
MKPEFKPEALAVSLGFFILLAFNPIVSFAQCDCDFIISLSGTEWQFDGEQKGVQPGDKICFTSGTRTGIHFKNVHGTAENPVIITNMCDGKVVLNVPSNWGNAMDVTSSSHFRITGSGNPNEVLGIEILGAVMGVNLRGLSTNFEVDHLYVHDVGCVGIVGKTDPTCDPATWRGNFTLRDAKFHHNKIVNTGCEGFYIGNSHYDSGKSKTCNGSTINVFEHDLENIEVHNNELRNIGNDGIQVGGSKNASIHHNYVFNTGLSNSTYHQNIVQVGNGTEAVVYNNFLDTGKGYGIFDQGGGNTHYNNIVINALQGGMLLQDTGPNWALTGFRIFNNTFINCKDYGVQMFSEHIDPTQFVNNIVVGQNQLSYVYVYFNNPSAATTKWVDTNNIKTQDITTLKFEDPAARNFRLKLGSPAIDAGKDLSGSGVALHFDYDEKPRPRNEKFDIGAFEFQTSGPTAFAGPDQSIYLPTNSIVLNGSGTSATGITAYHWTKKSGGLATLVNQTTPNLSVTGLVEGTYVFELQVTDAEGFDFDEVMVTVLPQTVNRNPTANAGSDQNITLPTNSAILNGIGTDPDGTITAYNWIKISGPSCTLTGANTSKLTLTDLLEGAYVFQLTVTDDRSATASDQVQVTVSPDGVNEVPVVSAGAQKTIFLPTDWLDITATASDPDGTISSIVWEKKSGGAATLANANTLTVTASGLVLGTYVFRITVTDNSGATAFSEVTVKVLQANQSPVADAGPDQALTLPTNSVILSGSGADPDGSIVSYAWAKSSGPSATLTDANTHTLQVTDMVQGTYVFGLTVTDNNNAAGYDEVTVAVSVAPNGPNEVPLAIAGGNYSFSLPTNSVNLYGSGFDPDGSIVSYLWTKASGGTATLINFDKPTVTVTNLQSGQYNMRLTVTDDKGGVDDDIAIITVSDEGTNIFPVASVGADQIVRLPQNATILKGSGSDADGQVTNYAWMKVSGGPATIKSPDAGETLVSNLTEGIYVFRLTVTDNLNATDQNEITVRVVSNSFNLPPLVDAGRDTILFLPQTFLTLNAHVTDDGTITAYQWAKLSGPDATLVNAAELNLSLTDLVEGEYSFQLIVTDDDGGSVFDIVKVTVLPASFSLPVVDAGSDQVITLPVNQVTLNGTASSAAGTIVSTIWTQTLGPPVVMSGENSLTLQLTDMVEGTYVFKLTATDNADKMVSDNVQVMVKPVPPNQVPIVNSGVNQSLLLPISEIELAGSAIDEDGYVVSVLWSQILGPPSAILENEKTLNLTVRNLQEGAYVFRLTATDDKGATGSSDVMLFVADPASSEKKPPIVFAGDDKVFIAADNEAVIIGLAFDPDGSIEHYLWEQIIGSPTTFTINENALHLTDMKPGSFGFRFSATDNDLLTTSDELLISVIGENEEIPKFFSPNDDGIGDTWSFRNSDNYSGCSLKVFNRSGKEVYAANPYENNWNGFERTGSPVEDGDYYYILLFPDGRQIKGALRVIR